MIHVPGIVQDAVVFLLRSEGMIPLDGIRTGELPVSSFCSNAPRCYFLFCGLRQFGPDRSENMRPMEMAVNLLRCRRQALGGKNWKPQYRVVGDMVELTGVEVRITFCGLRRFGPDRSENMRSMEMVTNLLRCRRQELGKENWKPQNRVVGDMGEVTGVEVKVKGPTLEPAPCQCTI